jgi:hypothetical protein
LEESRRESLRVSRRLRKEGFLRCGLETESMADTELLQQILNLAAIQH